MKLLFLLFFFIGIMPSLHSQSPAIQWQKCIGGDNHEYLWDNDWGTVQVLTRDKKHIIVAGTTYSNGGDMGVGLIGRSDIWVGKADLNGTFLWTLRINGHGFETFGSIEETDSGDFIVAGSSAGGTSPDAIVIKVSVAGEVLWKKYYGGTLDDVANRIIQTVDKGYVFLGESWSADGDLSGLPQENYLWLCKLDQSGNLVWSKKFPTEKPYQFIDCTVLKQDGDGTLIIGANIDEGPNNRDILLCKLTSDGELIWRKVYKGSQSDHIQDIDQLSENKFIITGYTLSNDGDFPSPSPSHLFGGLDSFLMTIDSLGNITWLKRFGGNNHDQFLTLRIMSDFSYLVLGQSRSGNGDLEGNTFRGQDQHDIWLTNIDPQGNVRWSKTYGGVGNDYGIGIGILSESSFIMLGETVSHNFDVTGLHGGSDFWLVKVGNTSKLSGSSFFDVNLNGIKDLNEGLANEVQISLKNSIYDKTIMTSSGLFEIEVDTGSYQISASRPYYDIAPNQSSVSFVSHFQTHTIDFALRSIPGINDLQVIVLPLTAARPGFPVSYKIVYRNVGTTAISNPVLKFVKSDKITVSSAVPQYSGLVSDTLSWKLSTLIPHDTGSIDIKMTLARPPVVVNGFVLTSYAFIAANAADITPEDNSFQLKQIVTGSYDPNDKTEANGGVITPAQVTDGDYLNYLIRFQNTGTDTAFNVIVRDTLDGKLDWSSLQMISASHAYQLAIKEDDKLAWEFSDIKLPDSNVNERLSHGYIAYRIKPKSTVVVGDVINNTAGIYFDFNLPVATNIHATSVLPPAVEPSSVTITSFNAILQSSKQVLIEWDTQNEQNVKSYEVQKSSDGINFSVVGLVPPKTGSTNTYSLDDGSPYEGTTYYRLKSIQQDGTYALSAIVSVTISPITGHGISLYPNPGSGDFTLRLNGYETGEIHVRISDVLGRVLLEKKYAGQGTSSVTIPINLNGLRKGVYLIQIQAGQPATTHKLIIQ